MVIIPCIYPSPSFIVRLVPIAEAAAALQESAATSFEKLHYTQIIEDIVSLFPANCVSCPDLPTTLPTVASSLMMALSTSTNISVTMSLCKGLLILIKANQKVLKITFDKNVYIHTTYNEEDEDDEEDDEELKKKTNDREDIDVDQVFLFPLPLLLVTFPGHPPPEPSSSLYRGSSQTEFGRFEAIQ